MTGGPYAHRFRTLPSGDSQCRVCGHVAAAPHGGPDCPANVDMVRDWAKLCREPRVGPEKAEKAAQELHRMLREGGEQ